MAFGAAAGAVLAGVADAVTADVAEGADLVAFVAEVTVAAVGFAAGRVGTSPPAFGVLAPDAGALTLAVGVVVPLPPPAGAEPGGPITSFPCFAKAQSSCPTTAPEASMKGKTGPEPADLINARKVVFAVPNLTC